MSDVLDKRQAMSRQSQIVGDLSDFTAVIIGVGGIGSNAAHILDSMGVGCIHLVDHDVVGVENIYPGYFTLHDIGRPKVEAVADKLSCDTFTYQDRFSPDGDPPNLSEVTIDLLLLTTDTIESRLFAYQTLGGEAMYTLDARMGGVNAQVFTIDRVGYDSHIERLTGTTNNDLPCGEKATSPITKGFLVGMIGNSVVKISKHLPPPSVQIYSLGGDYICAL